MITLGRKTNVALLALLVSFVLYQALRPSPIIEVKSIDAEERRGNFDLYVYVYNQPFNLRTSGDFTSSDNIAETLERGDVFYFDTYETGRTMTTINNFPEDQRNAYEFVRINLLDEGKLSKYYTMTAWRSFTGNEQVQYTAGVQVRSLPLIDFIRYELKENGCTFETKCTRGHFAYHGGGLYSTTLLHDTTYYNRHGKRLGTLRAGSKILSSFNLPYAVGYDDVTKVRAVGFIEAGSKFIVMGTIFFDLFEGDERTIATQAITKNDEEKER